MTRPSRVAGAARAALVVLGSLAACSADGAGGGTGGVPEGPPPTPPTEQSVVDAVLPEATDLRRAGLIEGDELPGAVVDRPVPLPPDPCDVTQQAGLPGAPAWSLGRAVDVRVPEGSPAPDLVVAHRVWRFDDADDARALLAGVTARTVACRSVAEGERADTFELVGEQDPQVVEYRWTVSTGPVTYLRRYVWTQHLNDVVQVEVSTREPSGTQVEMRELAADVAGRVLDREVDHQRYGEPDDEDA